MTHQFTEKENGYTIAELLVSMGIFSVIALAIATFMNTTFKRVGFENRTALASQELRNAVGILSAELRMGSLVSPYLPGIETATTFCASALSVSDNAISFLVTHDDNSATNGIQPYLVGYSYDSASQELRRGEIAKSGNSDCVVPTGDPASTSIAAVMAKKIVPIDTDGDGNNEPIFTYTAPTLQLNMGVQVDRPGGGTITQRVSTAIVVRKAS